MDWEKAARLLSEWYGRWGRDLPWRRTTDAYAIWISEAMLQQTQVSRVIDYYGRWMAALPRCRDLAVATEERVLELWHGLGYYRRAKNLRAAAAELISAGMERPPADWTVLRSLPGFGPYTASAVMALAYDQPFVALDGNLRRVAARLIDLPTTPTGRQGERACHDGLAAMLPFDSPRQLTNGLMDLGSGPCAPRPQCLACPLENLCQARRHGTVDQRPVRRPRPKVNHRFGAALLFLYGGRVALRRRPEEGLWAGFWEVPWRIGDEDESPEVAARRLAAELAVTAFPQPTDLTTIMRFTHWQVNLHAFRVLSVPAGTEMVPLSEALKWPMPLGIQRLLKATASAMDDTA